MIVSSIMFNPLAIYVTVFLCSIYKPSNTIYVPQEFATRFKAPEFFHKQPFSCSFFVLPVFNVFCFFYLLPSKSSAKTLMSHISSKFMTSSLKRICIIFFAISQVFIINLVLLTRVHRSSGIYSR